MKATLGGASWQDNDARLLLSLVLPNAPLSAVSLLENLL